VKQVTISFAFAVLALHLVGATQQPLDEFQRDEGSVRLLATRHPPLPTERSQYWFVQDASLPGRGVNDPALARFARGVKSIGDGSYAAGLPLVNDSALASTVMADYARYYTGVALAGLSRWADADTVLSALASRPLKGYLREAVPLRLAEVAQSRQDGARAERILRDLPINEVTVPEDVLLKLALVEESTGHREQALEAFRRVYYDYPLSPQADDAQTGIERLQSTATLPDDLVARALGRAERLYAAKRWAPARAAFENVARGVQGLNKDLVALRLAECDYRLDRYRAARDGVQPFLSGPLAAEARFFYLSAVKSLGDSTRYVMLSRDLVTDFPDSEWAAETLNNLAQYYLTTDEDDAADRVFREILMKFPRHRYAERAAWKAGWTDYRAKRFAETAAIYESAALTFPRADTRPAWLYWSGRARDRAGDAATANSRYQLLVTDYANSYYGRLASAILSSRRQPLTAQPLEIVPASVTPVTPPVTDVLMRVFTALQLYDDAQREVQYAQQVWGDTPQLQATSAWIRNQQGLGLKSQDRFNALRGAITTMRRAYPQFLTAGGENIPPDVLRVIFPLDYWPLIERYSQRLDLDPYLIAALMAQESTFTAEIRSPANARGLLQLMPSTARRYATKLGIRPFTTALLAQPEVNVRIGAQYFKELMDRFGGAHFALASYNAGESRVSRWIQDAPGLPTDEFIDNIPFPETQNYVKRILGTADDYRQLYGGGRQRSPARLVANPAH
jgi:soluble lytic murein transglycosylase